MIEKIKLKNWKGFRQIDLEFNKGTNFIIGPNGIGKTAILEAICVAFAGRTPSLKNVRDLVNKNFDRAEINVQFRINGRSLKIIRKLTSRRLLEAEILDGSQIIERGNWTKITNYLEELFKIGMHFFERIIYLSEGEIYRLISNPPEKILTDQIDRVLGVNQLESLSEEIEKINKDIKAEQEEYREMHKKLDIEKIIKPINFEKIQRELKILEKDRIALEKELLRKRQELWGYENKLKQKTRIKEELQEIDKRIKGLYQLKDKIQAFQKRYKTHEKELEKRILERSELLAERKGHQTVLELITDFDFEGIVDVGIPCPVCKKSLAQENVKDIQQEKLDKILKLDESILSFSKKIEDIKLLKAKTKTELDDLIGQENRIKTITKEYDLSEKGFEELNRDMDFLTHEIHVLSEYISGFEVELTKIENEIDKRKEKMTLSKIVEKIKDKGVIEEKLIATARSEFFTEIIEDTIKDTIQKQRDEELRRDLYQEISHFYNKFKSDEGWTVKLNRQGRPVLMKANNRFDPTILSGGEKTALVVITHTLISIYFAKNIGFMFLDEPLEHLDPKNRRSLIKYLVDSCKSGLLRQLIVTTFEESLVRKYMDSEYVNIVPLLAYTPFT